MLRKKVLLSSPSGVRNKPSSRSSSSNNVKKQSSGRSSSSTSRSHTFGSAEAKRADEAKRGAWQAEISSERRSIERSPSSTSPDEAKRVAWNSEIEKQRETRHAWGSAWSERLDRILSDQVGLVSPDSDRIRKTHSRSSTPTNEVSDVPGCPRWEPGVKPARLERQPPSWEEFRKLRAAGEAVDRWTERVIDSGMDKMIQEHENSERWYKNWAAQSERREREREQEEEQIREEVGLPTWHDGLDAWSPGLRSSPSRSSPNRLSPSGSPSSPPGQAKPNQRDIMWTESRFKSWGTARRPRHGEWASPEHF